MSHEKPHNSLTLPSAPSYGMQGREAPLQALRLADRGRQPYATACDRSIRADQSTKYPRKP